MEANRLPRFCLYCVLIFVTKLNLPDGHRGVTLCAFGNLCLRLAGTSAVEAPMMICLCYPAQLIMSEKVV